MQLSKEKGKIRALFGIVVVVSCFLNFCPIGSYYSYGNMAPYVISYTRVKSIDPNKEIVEMNASPWLVGSCGVVQGFGFVLGGWLAGKIGPRPTATVGSFIFTCSTFLTAGSLKLSFWAVIVTYGMLSAIGLCMCYMALLTSVTQWLPHHTGLGIGLIMMGLGGSSFAFIPLQTAFINPNDEVPNHQSNKYPEFFYFTQEDILERVPTMFIILGTIYVVFQLISIPFIVEYRDVELQSKSISSILKYVWSIVKPRMPNICWQQHAKGEPGLHKTMKETILESEHGSDHHSSTVNTAKLSLEEVEMETNVNLLELLKRWDFYLILFGVIAVIASDSIILALYKIIGHNEKYRDHVLAVIGSIASLSNCVGRILLGHLADQIPCKVVLVLIFGGISSFSYTFLATPIVGIWMFGVWIFVIFLCIGGSFSVLPTCCRSWYGQKHFSTNYGMLRSGTSIGGAVSIIMSTYGYSALGWEGLFLFTGSLCFLGMLAIVIGGDRTLKAKDEPNKGQ